LGVTCLLLVWCDLQAAPAATAAAGAAGSAQQQQMALNAVLVSRRQQGNPMLKHIKYVIL
jgi:hypothetical protein